MVRSFGVGGKAYRSEVFTPGEIPTEDIVVQGLLTYNSYVLPGLIALVDSIESRFLLVEWNAVLQQTVTDETGETVYNRFTSVRSFKNMDSILISEYGILGEIMEYEVYAELEGSMTNVYFRNYSSWPLVVKFARILTMQ
ncbi:MAG: hypothetical protein HQM11_07710 [SAR324 cluster bacterium]|nr:hypothetical protein [SAR324 cluster bacterium]